MASALEAKIAQVASTVMCRFCGHAIPAEAVICACRIERGELPHTEWPRELKRMLCVRAIERRMWHGTREHEMWVGMLKSTFGGTIQGTPKGRVVLKYNESEVVLFPFAAGEAALWTAAGCPTLFTI